MTEKPTHLTVIQGQPNLTEANRLVGSLTKTLISNENVGKTLAEAGFNSEELVANLDNFLYDSALTGSGQAEADPQIRMINMFRGWLEPFLPDVEGDDSSVRHGKVRSSGRTGKKDTGGAGFEPFD